MYLSILKVVVSTAHGAEELGMYSHGHARPAPRLLHRVLPRILAIFEKRLINNAGKNIMQDS
jgi:hypothetical protein